MDRSKIPAEIRKFGKYEKKDGRKDVYAVTCTVCGKKIMSNDEDVQSCGVSVSRRGSAVFWCPGCESRVWNSRIH